MTAEEPAGARYAVTLAEADVGRRVVVRRRLPDGRLSDLLGVLQRWDDEVVVRDRSGALRTAARADVVAAKRVPPPPVRR